MALSSSIVWEVRTTGQDTNGGGFKAGASGTDWTQQDAPQYSTVDAVTNGTTTITSVSASFGTDVVGNVLYITGGTGSITGAWYEIVSRTDANTIVVDRSTGLTTGTGATLKIGGALATLGQANTNLVAGNSVWVKATATYSISTGITLTGGSSGNYVRWRGYTTTRGDGGKATIQASASMTYMLTTGARNILENFILDANTQTSTSCVSLSGLNSLINNCHAKNFTAKGIAGAVTAIIANCYATGGTSAASYGISAPQIGLVSDCVASGNACVGFSTYYNYPCIFLRCIAASNSGSSSDGFQTNGTVGSSSLFNCVAYGNGRDGLRAGGSTASDVALVSNSIFANNGGYGINMPDANGVSFEYYCAFYSNTSGSRNNIAAGTGSVTLTGDPFTNAAGGDFSLNNTSGAGAACRAAGFPGVLPGVSTTGYVDIGVAQHQDAGGGGGTTLNLYPVE